MVERWKNTGLVGWWAVFMVLGISASAHAFPSSMRSQAAVKRATPGLLAALEAKGLRFGAPVFIRIFKEEKTLEVWVEAARQFELFAKYSICSFSGLLGPKLQQGDNQAPEGFYFVGPQALNPSSTFHLSFNLGYPNLYDRTHGRTGNFLMVHGDCVSIGCYAMTDSNIEQIWTLADAALRGGQPFFRVHIFPFRMTEEKMRSHERSRWISFWNNLQSGFRMFEDSKRPPNVEVSGGEYVFN